MVINRVTPVEQPPVVVDGGGVADGFAPYVSATLPGCGAILQPIHQYPKILHLSSKRALVKGGNGWRLEFRRGDDWILSAMRVKQCRLRFFWSRFEHRIDDLILPNEEIGGRMLVNSWGHQPELLRTFSIWLRVTLAAVILACLRNRTPSV